jgi:hypothetical protein
MMRTGNRQQAREHLTTAAPMYREIDMRFDESRRRGAHESFG